jgi:hypothetical protein
LRIKRPGDEAERAAIEAPGLLRAIARHASA